MIALALQLGLAVSFLTSEWRPYLSKAFEFSRSFLYKWTVNWRFVPENAFLSRRFALALLLAHLVLLYVAVRKWTQEFGGFGNFVSRLLKYPKVPGAILPQQVSPKCG